MRLTTVILIASLMQVSAAGFAQRLSLDVSNGSLKSVFKSIRSQSGYNFVYSEKIFDRAKPVNINVKNVDFEQVMGQLFENQPLTYQIENNTVVVRLKEKPGIIQQIIARFQNIDIQGRVVSEDGSPLPGAAIRIKGASRSTSTDNNGYFSLGNVDETAVLQISYIGYRTLELPAKADMGTIKLEISTADLQEVEVRKGYYTEKKILSSSNVVTVTAKDIESQPVSNPLLALQGRVPSMQITPANGFAGAGISVRVQGQNSISRGNSPFYVVDGVPVSGDMPTNLSSILSGNGNNGGSSVPNSFGNPLAYLNLGDIESIDVLRDADATAIFGSQAANGAILITTKKGKAGQSRLNFSFQNGWGKVGHFVDVLSLSDYFAMRKEAIQNSGQSVPTFQANPVFNVNALNTNYDLTVWDPNKDTNWQKELIGGTAGYQDGQLAFSGGSTNTTFRVNGGYHRETTVFPGDFSDTKGSVGFSLNHNSPNKRLSLQFTGNYLKDNNRLFFEDLTAKAMRLAPNAPDLYNADGSLNWAQIPNSSGGAVSTWQNPLLQQYLPNTLKTDNLMANTVIGYELVKGLQLKSNFGYNNLRTVDTRFSYLEARLPEVRSTSVRSTSIANGNSNNWVVEPQLSFTRILGSGQLQALLGGTIQSSRINSTSISANGFASDQLMQNLGAALTFQNSSSDIAYRYSAVFARINYNWKEKYALNLTARRDGTSRFGSENRFANFWSAGGSWVFSKEDFAKNWHVLSFGKLRANYGTTGNQQIGDYQYLSLYNAYTAATPYQGITGLAPNGLSNPYLAWERTAKLSVGTELGFLKDRINLVVDFYRNRSSNQLTGLPLPIQTGFGSVPTNLPATVQNQGWEFTLNTANVQSKDWKWKTTFMASILRNKLTGFTGRDLSTSTTLMIGQPVSVSKQFSYAGVDPATGAALFYKADGTTTTTPVSPADLVYIYNPTPKWTGSFQTSLSWKQLSLDVMLQYVSILQSSLTSAFNSPGAFFGQSTFGNIPQDIYDNSWKGAGHNARFEKLQATSFYNSTAQSSSLAYTDGSYLKLRNVALSYALPAKWQQKLSTKNARLFMNGQNLYTFTNYNGIDPETGPTSLPPLRVITLGIQAEF